MEDMEGEEGREERYRGRTGRGNRRNTDGRMKGGEEGEVKEERVGPILLLSSVVSP